jgi:hypothetical protein
MYFHRAASRNVRSPRSKSLSYLARHSEPQRASKCAADDLDNSQAQGASFGRVPALAARNDVGRECEDGVGVFRAAASSIIRCVAKAGVAALSSTERVEKQSRNASGMRQLVR